MGSNLATVKMISDIKKGTIPAGRLNNILSFGTKQFDGSSPQTITAEDLGLADVYKTQGSIAFSALPATPSADTYGYVWNITNDFTTDSRFIEGAGVTCNAGTNVGVIEQNGTYYYDILGNFVDLSNYAQINGTYPNMTVGNATNAQKLGNVDVSQYAQITGMYPDMTVGNAQFANSLANKLYVRQSIIGWYKIAEFTVTGSNYNAFSVIILVNGVYGSRTSGNPEESGLLEVDIRKDPNGINASGSSLSILAGNLKTNHFAFNTSGNLLSLYWYQDYEYASVNFTVLDSKSENDDECSYELRLGSFSSTLDNATYASNVVNAANDSLGNSIKDSYIDKWEMANATVNGSLIWGSGWIDFKRSGNVCICTFEITAPSTVAAWTNRKIANYPSGYSNGYGTIVGAGQMDSVDNMVPVTIYAQPDGIYINGKAHTIDSNRQVCGFVVWLTGHLKG